MSLGVDMALYLVLPFLGNMNCVPFWQSTFLVCNSIMTSFVGYFFGFRHAIGFDRNAMHIIEYSVLVSCDVLGALYDRLNGSLTEHPGEHSCFQ